MKYLTFTPEEYGSYDVCFLLPEINDGEIRRQYIDAHLQGDERQILAYSLLKGPAKKTPVTIQREYLAELMPILRDLSVKYLVVCDAEYFKTVSGQSKAEGSLGYVLDTPEGECHGFKVLYCPNFRQVFHNPDKVLAEISIALKALNDHRASTYVAPGSDIIHSAAYPMSVSGIKEWLQRLLDMDCDFTADIETFSLKPTKAGIGTITFCWDKHSGIAFPVDLMPSEPEARAVRQLLVEFFYALKQRGNRLIWHKIDYDVTVLIYQLFMSDILDTAGLLEGIDVLLTHWECTRIISYLATNSCAGNDLSLKSQAQEFAGNWAVEDIEDIRKIPLEDLLRYNLVDGLSTWYVAEKHWQTLVDDQQEEIYNTIFKPAMLDIIQMQLTGLPINLTEVAKLKAALQEHDNKALKRLEANIFVKAFVGVLQAEWVDEYNTTRKVKRVTIADATPDKVSFNPGSPQQLQRLLFNEEFLDLPVLDLTDSKLPATGGKTLEKLKNHTTHPDIMDLLDALIQHKQVDKLLTSFIPAFEEAELGPDGHHYLMGFFNLGGTVSGRLSSSGPNLQNLPAGNKPWGKEVKACFMAPEGWLFVGLDFDSLEDRISALTTKDPNKLKVYVDGYDGHCLRAYSYFGVMMPDIDGTSVQGINSIKDLYPRERQDSKTPTFLLTYGGTHHGIVNQLGWTLEKARIIEEKYHELYRVSDEWVAERIQEATKTGYVTCAFGLRVRTPLLKQVILNTRQTPYEAQAESRTAGNAMGQSWCLLNSRAASDFMGRVRKSKYRLDIRPCAHIHDAQYYLIRNNIETLLYTNEHLVNAVKWQDHPDIAHDTVKLGGALDVFHPNWACPMGIPNNANENDIPGIVHKHFEKYSLAA